MDKRKNFELIRELSCAPGAPGFEDEVLKVIRRHGEGLGDWQEDAMRNLYLRLSGWKEGKPVLMLDAHSDEVGFMIRAIRPNGTLDFVTLGGWVSYCLPAHKVLVRNGKGEWISGVIASKPPHYLSESDMKKMPEISEMVIDVGASSDREIREEYHISIASPVVPDVSFEYRENHDIMIGKAFDDRLGCAAIVSILKELAGEELSVNVAAAFSVQEETGLRGAAVTAQTVKPDIAIAFEGTPADDTVVEAYAIQSAIKKGPMLRHLDVSMITNPRFQRFALDSARANGIPVQEAVRTGGSTNAAAIHLSGKAVPVIVISVPARYIHTHYSISSYSDFENSVRLACAVIRKLDDKVIKGF